MIHLISYEHPEDLCCDCYWPVDIYYTNYLYGNPVLCDHIPWSRPYDWRNTYLVRNIGNEDLTLLSLKSALIIAIPDWQTVCQIDVSYRLDDNIKLRAYPEISKEIIKKLQYFYKDSVALL